MKKKIKIGKKKIASDIDSIAQEFATEYDVDIDDVEISEESNHGVDYWEVEVESEEFIVFSGYADAEQYAENYVYEMLQDDPELFNLDWLEQHIYVSDTDKRLISQDMVDYYYDMDEEDVVRDADVEEEYEDAKERGDTNGMARIVDQAREDLAEDESNHIYNELDDPIGYFVNEMGMYSVEDLMKQSFIRIDEREAATDAVATDGVAHFLAHYDGEERELGDLVYYRTN